MQILLSEIIAGIKLKLNFRSFVSRNGENDFELFGVKSKSKLKYVRFFLLMQILFKYTDKFALQLNLNHRTDSFYIGL